jgi:hypothetical protein
MSITISRPCIGRSASAYLPEPWSADGDEASLVTSVTPVMEMTPAR